ncbi:MAG: sugar diacid recognition domain-containing protein [Bacillota bacterium]
MQISKTSAMQIVTEISSIINHDVNMMDDKGIIIASTDKARLGTYHAGANMLVQNSLNELIISTDEQYEGTKQGINLPILFEGNIVGVIGVTGKWEEVGKYGQIIKKMTEILLLDTYIKNQQRIHADIRNGFIEEWLFEDSKNINEEFAERGMLLGINITLPRQIMIVAVNSHNHSFDLVANQKMSQLVEEIIYRIIRSESDNVYYKSVSKIACIITQRSEAQLRRLAEHICEEVERGCFFRPAIGIDSIPVDYHRIYHTYRRAEKALRNAISAGEGAIRFYSDLNIEILVDEIPNTLKTEFIHKIFRDCTDEEIEQWISILNVYFECNGSIARCAQRLYLHKNTIQYKLRKLSEYTGYDPRNLSKVPLYYMAIAFYNSLSGEEKFGRSPADLKHEKF